MSPASRSSRWARSAKYAGVAASPASSRHGSKNDERMMPLGIFSTPNTSTQSYCPARIAPAASCSAAPPLAQPASTSTIGMPVQRERAEHLVARRDAAVRGAAERGLERRVAGLGERGAHRVHAHVGGGHAVEAPERMDADAGDRRVTANAHVTTPSRQARRRRASSAGRTSSCGGIGLARAG